MERILQEEGYRCLETGQSDRTLIVDLEAPLEELKAALDPKWRNKLYQAEKNGLEVISGQEEGLFDEVSKMYGEMAARKGIEEAKDIDHLRLVQRDLPEVLKLRVIVCRLKGEPCAGAIFGAIGTTGIYIRGATSDAGLKTNGSYIVQWGFVRWLKEQGFLHYDLNGINPDANPGTYYFKRGLAGRRGRDVEFLGRFQVADSLFSYWIVREGEWLLSGYRRMVRATRALRATSKRRRRRLRAWAT